MTHTFDIRFARSVGLAAFLEAPENRFHWKGGGLLSIDAQSITFTVKRSLLGLFAANRTQQISTENLREVYREGEALRVEFQTGKAARVVLPFWASNPKAAAEIVRLLPTQHSVELEDSPASSTRRYRFDRRLAALLLAGIVALGFGVLILQRYLAPSHNPVGEPAAKASTPVPTPDVSAAPSTELQVSANPVVAPRTPGSPAPALPAEPDTSERVYIEPPALPASMDAPELAAMPVPMPAAAPRVYASPQVWRVRASRDGVFAITPESSTYAIAREQLDIFLAESNTLRADWLYMRDFPSAEGLRTLEARWENVTARIYSTAEFAGIEFLALREIELAVSRSWRGFLSNYAAALRTKDEVQIANAFVLLAFAERLEALVSQFVR